MGHKRLNEDKLIIITGGAGFIGSALTRHLNDQGIVNIVLVDDFGLDEKWKNLVGKRFIEVVPTQKLFEWLEGRREDIAAHIHLGACSDTTERDADFLLQNNTRYSIRLCEYALWAGHRFIYASSAATYGDGSQGFSDDHSKIDTLRPLNMYGYSKQMFDQWLLREGLLDSVVGLKYFNVFGPNEGHKGRMASAVVKMVDQIAREGEVKLFRSSEPEKYADGEQERDFIYIKDVVRMTAAFLEDDRSGIYNIGTGRASTWNQLARATFAALGKEAKIDYIEMPEELHGKYQNHTQAEMAKYGDFSTTSLEASVADYVQNHLIPGELW